MADEKKVSFLGTTAEQKKAPKSFSRSVSDVSPSSTGRYERYADTGKEAREGLAASIGQGLNFAAETYAGFQATKAQQAADQISSVAHADALGALRPEDIEELARTDNLFKKYAAARRQGAMADSAANIAVESEIKRLSNTFPLLGPQVRQAAHERLGFDPTGAQYKFRINPYPSGKQSPSHVESIMQEATQLANALGADPAQMQQAMLKNYYLKQTNAVRKQITDQATQSAGETINGALDSAQESVTDTSVKIFSEAAKNNGILSDESVQQYTMQLNMEKQQALQNLQKTLSKKDVYKSQREDAVDRLRKKYDNTISMLEKYQGSKTLADRNKFANLAIQATMQQMVPIPTALISMGVTGEPLIQMSQALMNPDSILRKSLASTYPIFARLNDVPGGADYLADSLKSIASGDISAMKRLTGDPSSMTKAYTKWAMEHPEFTRNPDGSVDKSNMQFVSNLFQANDSAGGGDYLYRQVAQNPDKYSANQGIISSYKNNVLTTRWVSAKVEDMRSQIGGDFQFKVEDGKIIVDFKGNSNPSVAGHNSLVVSNNPTITEIQHVGEALGNSSFSSKVSMSQQQFVNMLNQSVNNPQQMPQLQPTNDISIIKTATENGLNPDYFTRMVGTDRKSTRQNSSH